MVVTYLVAFVVPKFGQLSRDMNVELPTATKILIALTVDYRVAILGILAGVIVVALGVFFWSRSKEGARALTRLNSRSPRFAAPSLRFKFRHFPFLLRPWLTV